MKIKLSEFLYTEEPLDGEIDASVGPSFLPERHLWQAAIVQLLIDATQQEDNMDRRSARAFFEASIEGAREGIPTTATWREDVCHLGGFSPDMIQSIYWKLITNGASLGKYRVDDILEQLK